MPTLFKKPLLKVAALYTLPFSVLATSYEVNTPLDVVMADNLTSLREAIQAANTNTAVGDAPAGSADEADIITFTAGAASTLAITDGQLMISEDLVIDGGTQTVTVNASQASSRIFQVSAGSISIKNMTLANGTTAADDPNGGALLVASGADVTLEGVTLSNNTSAGAAAGEGGGGVANFGTLSIIDGSISNNSVSGAAGNGGGIFNAGSLSINGTEVTGNSANRAGGGIENANGTVAIVDANISNNSIGTAPGNGGGLHSAGADSDIDIFGSTFDANTAGNEGGGIWIKGGTLDILSSETGGTTISNNTASGVEAANGGGGIFITFTEGEETPQTTIQDATINNNTADGEKGSGGGIFNTQGILNISDSQVSNNVANRAGGGIETVNGEISLSNVSMTANNVATAPAVPAPGNGGALHVSGSANVVINSSAFADNLAGAEGGALWNGGGESSMAVNDSSFSNNIASGADDNQGGGAIFNGGANDDGGILTVNRSRFTNNAADGEKGSGGAILNSGGESSVIDSIFEGNTALRAGGAIEENARVANTTLNLTRVTMDANQAGSAPGNGGALHISGAGVATVDLSTVSNNSAASEGGGLWNSASGTLNVYNSTISSNNADGTDPTNGGGGLFTDGGNMVVINSTITLNTATQAGGGVFVAEAASATITNSIVSDNSAANGNDISGSSAVNYSLVKDQTGATITGGDNVAAGTDPELGPLQINGGTTKTHAISSGAAIDSADSSVCSGADINNLDQREVPREAACDIGAFEFVDSPVVTSENLSPTANTANEGEQIVEMLILKLSNNESEAVTVSQIKGVVDSRGNFGQQVEELRVFTDDNVNSQYDSTDTEVAITANYNPTGGSFSITFSDPQSIAANSDISYIVAADFDTDFTKNVMTAAAALFLPLLWLMRRRAAILLAIVGISLSACSTDNNGGGNTKSVRITATEIQATGSNSGKLVIFTPLPASGAVVTPE